VFICKYTSRHISVLSLLNNAFLWNNVGSPTPSPYTRYWLIAENKDWQSAANHCFSKNTALVAITSAPEQAALTRYLSKYNSMFVCYGVATGGSGGSRNRGPELLKISSGETQQLFTKA